MKNSAQRMAVVDLHCDLLCYLAEDALNRSAYDTPCNCSIPQLQAGLVKLQTMAIFTTTGAAALSSAAAQAEIFSKLATNYQEFELLRSPEQLSNLQHNSKILAIAAIENASGICSETEPLTAGLERFEKLLNQVGPLLYVSLTWNGENRFGGGCGASSGLTDDGRILIDLLIEKDIAIDFSHTSDALAFDILTHLDRLEVTSPLLASHSNYRALCDAPRNLPDEIAKEIFRRGGVVGLNAVGKFLGEDSVDCIAKHLLHGRSLGGEGKLVFGADFFFPHDVDPTMKPCFPTVFADSSHYPKLITALEKTGTLTASDLADIASLNASRFIQQVLAARWPTRVA